MIRALLLDAAGTLIEPAEPVAAVYARQAAAVGHPVDPAAIREAFRNVFSSLPDPDWAAYSVSIGVAAGEGSASGTGNGNKSDAGDLAESAWWRQVVHRTFAAAGVALPQAVAEDCFEALFAHYARPEAWTVFPEVPAVLDFAAARGWRCAVVSNFDRRLHGILAGHGLASRFELIVTSADASARKPDPAIFHRTLSRLALAPEEVIHLGDSQSADVEGPTRAGIQGYLLERPQENLLGLLERVAGR